ncbi:MAG: flagellar type III secretion system pore protein FliP [Alphaproteobacteria bacterium]|nr:flagellar type III secretion system pore protein FliP [Alphaproteobacteria bacterium]
MMNRKKIFGLFVFVVAMLISFSASAQSLSVNLSDAPSGTATGRIFSVLALITVLSLAPSILIMMTSFTRIAVVFSITRTALSTNTSPSNMVLVSLALFLTMFVMGPTVEKSWEEGLKPMIDEKIEAAEGLEKAMNPLKEFMVRNTREKDLMLFSDLSGEKRAEKVEDASFKVVVPAFMISELRRAFEIGFLIYVPFLIIDMVIASVLMSMGMMMLPPSVLALPFKVIFFVLIDGWYLLAGSLINSFNG